MRTLVFCTAYAATPKTWGERYRPWLDAIRQMALADQVLIVDDGSQVLPGWADTRISSGDLVSDAAVPCDPANGSDYAILHHFNQRLGRLSLFDFPGWYRSFTFGVGYAKAHGFDRVIHIESDAYLLSPRIQQYFRDFAAGWCALYCNKFDFPEVAIQVAAGDALNGLWQFAAQPYDFLRGQSHEQLIPFTQVERGFAGDRYGEDADQISRSLDFVCQVPAQREPSYYWWRAPAGQVARSEELPELARVDIDFTTGGESDRYVVDGWSDKERGCRWMIGFGSKMKLPAMPPGEAYSLQLLLFPFVLENIIPFQRLTVVINGHVLGDFEVASASVLGIDVPRRPLRRDGLDIVTFFHTDARQPVHVVAGNGDKRRLSLAMRRASFIARG